VSRIEEVFAGLRRRGERALIPYFCAGDPSLETTARLVEEAAARGADLIEVGLPFSDPLADGPTIQRAAVRALERGTSLYRLLPVLAGVSGRIRAPLIVMTYLNPLYRYGLDKVTRDLASAGVAGLIVPDCPIDESGPLGEAAERAGLDLIALAAPTSGPERLRWIVRASRGFVYLVPLTGITGERTEVPAELVRLVRDLRAVTTKPIGVGFGISTPDQVAAVVRHADGAIVGSAIVRMVERLADDPELVPTVGAFVAALKAATYSETSSAPLPAGTRSVDRLADVRASGGGNGPASPPERVPRG
jgi:tryptophan synthase alpha chain